MSLQVENLEHNMAKVTIEVEAAKLDDAIKQAFNKKKGQFNVPGFRKGKVPFQLIAKEYGVEIFYEDAFNEVVPEELETALKENKIEAVSRPEVDIIQMEKGKDLIEKEIKRIGISHSELFKTEYIEPLLEKYKYKDINDMYAAVGFGANSAVKIIARMLQEYKKTHEEENIEQKIEELAKARNRKVKPSNSGIIVKGIDNCLVKLSKCCNPLPGDEIVGYITKGRGVSVHRKDCVNVKDLISEENRMIDVKWYEEEKTSYNVDIEVYSNDRTGLLVDILKVIGTTKAKIMAVNTKTTKEKIAIIDISLEIVNLEELNKVIKAIRKVESVYEVKRKKK